MAGQYILSRPLPRVRLMTVLQSGLMSMVRIVFIRMIRIGLTRWVVIRCRRMVRRRLRSNLISWLMIRHGLVIGIIAMLWLRLVARS